MSGQKIGLNMSTYDRQESNSSPTATASQAGSAPDRRSRTAPSPGANQATRPATAKMAATWSARRTSRRPSSSRGSGSGGGMYSTSTGKRPTVAECWLRSRTLRAGGEHAAQARGHVQVMQARLGGRLGHGQPLLRDDGAGRGHDARVEPHAGRRVEMAEGVDVPDARAPVGGQRRPRARDGGYPRRLRDEPGGQASGAPGAVPPLRHVAGRARHLAPVHDRMAEVLGGIAGHM